MQYEKVDLVVLGGGIMGSMTAWRAAVRGLSVALVERFRPGHGRGSSHGSSRIYRYNYPVRDYVRWMQGAMSLWHELEAACGDQILYRCGCLDLAPDDQRAVLDEMAAAMLSCDIPSESWTREEVVARFPQFSPPRGVRGLWQADGGVVAADRGLQGAWSEARKLDVRLFVDHAVTRIDLEHERPTVIARDTAFRGKALVVSAGPFAPRLLGMSALKPTRQQYCLLRPEDPGLFKPGPFPSVIFYEGELAHYMCPILGAEGLKIARHGGGKPADPEVEKPNPAPEELERLRAYLKRWIPAAAGAPIEGGRTCFYTESPDTDFVIGPHPSRDDVVVLTGFSGHGFKFAPLVGQVGMELAVDKGTSWPIERFSPRRESLQPDPSDQVKTGNKQAFCS